MNKTFLIANREFMSRVKKKTFLLTTILLPVLFIGIYAASIYFSVKDDATLNVGVDPIISQMGKLTDHDHIHYLPLNSSRKNALAKDSTLDVSIIMPNPAVVDSLMILSNNALSLSKKSLLEADLQALVVNARVRTLKVSPDVLVALNKPASLNFISTDDAKSHESEANREKKRNVSIGISYVSGFLIYMVLFLFGMQVMRGVMEEKMNRISEVLICSVKPFQLMMGKILGVGAVGLLQFIIWIVLGVILRNYALQKLGVGNSDMGTMIHQYWIALESLNLPLILGCFLFYFLVGYFLYASLFAAIGSAVNDNVQDVQSLQLPVTMPLILAVVFLSSALNDPNGSVAVFFSIFPLTSPIVMMARVAQGVPIPQLIVSMILLLLTFFFFAWMAGKIYRTGILMYGKKPTLKTLIQWAKQK